MITTRRGTPDDMAVVGKIVAESWRKTFQGLLPQDFLLSITPEAQTERHKRAFSQRETRYHIACKGEQVVGFTSWGPSRDQVSPLPNELYAIYIAAEFERSGIGRLLFNIVSADIEANGECGFYLTVLALNPNRGFYGRLGGTEVEAPSLELGDRQYKQVAFVWRTALNV